MSRIIRIGLIAGLLFSGLIVLTPQYRLVFAQDPTIPTRTPTPEPQNPEVPPSPTTDSSDGGGSNPAPTATNTSEPQTAATATATATIPSVIVSTATATVTASAPLIDSTGGRIAADGCALPPRIRAIDLTLVHAGPGGDYPVLGSLPALEERPIVGRAEFAEWWQILLIETEPQLLGWVSDITVDEIGDTGSVPIVVPPLLNGIAPTPGALWEPTPLPPACTATPTATPTATTTSTVTPTATPSDAGGSGSTTNGEVIVDEQAVIVEGSAAEFDSQESTVGKQLQEGASGEAVDSPESTEATTSNESTTDGSGAGSMVVPLLGIALIAGGAIIALLSRSKPPTA